MKGQLLESIRLWPLNFTPVSADSSAIPTIKKPRIIIGSIMESIRNQMKNCTGEISTFSLKKLDSCSFIPGGDADRLLKKPPSPQTSSRALARWLPQTWKNRLWGGRIRSGTRGISLGICSPSFSSASSLEEVVE